MSKRRSEAGSASPLLEKIAKNVPPMAEALASPIASTSEISSSRTNVQVSSSSELICSPSQSVPPPVALTDGVFFSKVDCLGPAANSRALSLFELIRHIRPIASIHFNYSIDPQWVLRQYSRSLRGCPISFVVGHQQLAALRADCTQFPNVQYACVPMPFAYGTHHAKLSLFEADQALHVVISTANLLDDDWALKTQAFYHARGEFIKTSTDADEEKTTKTEQQRFRDDLLNYLRTGYPSSAGKAHQLVSYWIDRIGHADFGHIKDRIVGSVPGRHLNSDGSMHRFGHMRLRRLLSEKFDANERRTFKQFVGQFSSIGSLGARPEAWLCDEWLTSLSGGNSMLGASFLKLIFPSAENVRHSLEGYAAGLSLPYSSQVHNKQTYLRQFLHQWKSERLNRSSASPHVKSYTALDGQGRPRWLLLTSANLSGSAWGKLEKGRSQLFIRSFELGVLMCAEDHGGELPLPFDLPLTKYEPQDTPFLVDSMYPGKPDANGFRGAMEVRMAALT